LNQRAQTAGGRPVILSRGTVMTRGGVDALKEQPWAEAMRRGLGRADEARIVADGAVWIWNLAGDRFPGARLGPAAAGQTQGRCELRSHHRVGTTP
jgi:hypothetical protein